MICHTASTLADVLAYAAKQTAPIVFADGSSYTPKIGRVTVQHIRPHSYTQAHSFPQPSWAVQTIKKAYWYVTIE